MGKKERNQMTKTLTTEGEAPVTTLSTAEQTEVVAEKAKGETPEVVVGTEAGNRAWAETAQPVARLD